MKSCHKQGPEGSVQVDIHEKRQANTKGKRNKPAAVPETVEAVRWTANRTDWHVSRMRGEWD